jgi:hypothetical protein
VFLIPGFYAKAVDGRIDDLGCHKGEGIVVGICRRRSAAFEGGGHDQQVVHFQFRPDPLAH